MRGLARLLAAKGGGDGGWVALARVPFPAVREAAHGWLGATAGAHAPKHAHGAGRAVVAGKFPGERRVV